jgi:CSLREA domain-containing protein
MARFAALLFIAAIFVPASAFGATINVTTLADSFAVDGLCSLREAANAANFDEATDTCGAGSGPDVINVPAGTIVLLGIPVDLVSTVVVNGAGSSATTIDGNNARRVFMVGVASTVEIAGIQITRGRAPNGSTLGAAGGAGGGIHNAGNLTLRNAVVSDNVAGNGAGGIAASFPATFMGGPGGSGGDGGAIYSTGTLTLVDVTISRNQAGSGGAGGMGVTGVGGAGGSGGSGGGIYSTGPLTITDGSINDNVAGSGALGGAGTPSGPSGGGGDGGGVYNDLESLSVSNSTFSGNRTGTGGSSPTGIAQMGGDGGGLLNYGGTVLLAGTTFTGNTTGDGGGGMFPGSGGLGGGIANDQGTVTLLNTTVAGNATGNGGLSPAMTQGAAGSGAGIAVLDGATTLVHATVAGNRTGTGSVQLGGGLYVTGAGEPEASFKNSIVAGNIPQNCSLALAGKTVDEGNNISFPDTTCPGAGADPRLGPLQDNGGPTRTMALLAGSAAIDRVPAGAGCPATDQRGFGRPQGSACDSGAFEFVPPPIALDVTAPVAGLVVRRQRLGAAFRKGYVAHLTTNEVGKGVLELFTNVRKRPLAKIVRMRVAAGSRTLAAPGQYKIVAKFTRKAKKRFVRAQRLVVSVRLTVSDAAGNKTVKTKRVVLRR